MRIRLGWEERTVENVQQENTMTAMLCGKGGAMRSAQSKTLFSRKTHCCAVRIRRGWEESTVQNVVQQENSRQRVSEASVKIT